MIDIHFQIKRLYETHLRCQNSDNLSNYLDLAHTLRIISEYQDDISPLITEGAFFESEIIAKELNKYTDKPKMIILPIKPGVVNQSTLVGNIFWIGETLSDEQLSTITSPSHKFHKRKYSFDKYWGAQILFARRKKNKPLISINRLNLIQRVANTLGGSHIFTIPNDDSSEEDIIIYQLFKFMNILNIPLPYFACYKISQELLTMCGYDVLSIERK